MKGFEKGGAHFLFARGIRRPSAPPSNFPEWEFVRPLGGRKGSRERTIFLNVDCISISY
jgi:hypothetical protein